MIIEDRLRMLREEQNLSRGDIEKKTGLLRCYISRVENGQTVPAIVVNAHGALLRLDSVPPLGQKVTLHNIPVNQTQEAVVVFVGKAAAKDGKISVGVDFTKPNASFWRVSFTPAD